MALDPTSKVAANLECHRQRLVQMIARHMTPVARKRFDAEDVVQDAFHEIAARHAEHRLDSKPGDLPGSLDSGDNQPAFSFSFVYRVAMHKYIDRLRAAEADIRDVNRDVVLPDESALQIGNGFRTRESGPLSEVQKRELALLI